MSNMAVPNSSMSAGVTSSKKPRALRSAARPPHSFPSALLLPLGGARGSPEAAAVRVHDAAGAGRPALLQRGEDGAEADGNEPGAADALGQNPQSTTVAASRWTGLADSRQDAWRQRGCLAMPFAAEWKSLPAQLSCTAMWPSATWRERMSPSKRPMIW